MIRSQMQLLTLACLIFATANASAQAPLAPNQTLGFGNGRLVKFTYLQNFDCVDQPALDLDFNGKKAQSDPHEMQTPICQVVTEPTQDPAARDLKQSNVAPSLSFRVEHAFFWYHRCDARRRFFPCCWDV